MMAIKSKHKAPTLTILRQKQSWAGETTAALRGDCLKGAATLRRGAANLFCFVLLAPFLSAVNAEERREEGRRTK